MVGAAVRLRSYRHGQPSHEALATKSDPTPRPLAEPPRAARVRNVHPVGLRTPRARTARRPTVSRPEIPLFHAPLAPIGEMTARIRRVVWVVPGSTPGRDTRPKEDSPAGDRAFDHGYSWEGPPAAPDPGIPPPRATAVASFRGGTPPSIPEPRVGSPLEITRGPEPYRGRGEGSPLALSRTAGHPFSLLYELERHRGAFEVLVLLYGRGASTKSDMRRRLRPGQEALESSLACLTRTGLACCEPSSSFPFGKVYRLTELGTALVETPLCGWHRLIAFC